MQTVLIAVTIVSAGVAITMCAIVIRMLRDERRRSDARVDALMALTADSSDAARPEALPAVVVAPEPRERAASPAPQPSATASHAFRESDELELNPSAPVSGLDSLFAERESPSPWGRRLGVAAACAALLTVGAFALGSLASDVEAPGRTATQADAAAPLELLSLRHTAGPKTLTITGLVQNPRAGQAVTGITAVAFLFASDGSLLGSGRAPLDFTALRPGEESPFVVEVPAAGGVARYRVGFRNKDGEVIAHVDKRGAGALAQKD